jgi:hypothetical protein
MEWDAELLAAADFAGHAIVHGVKSTEPIERLNGMLGANLFAARAAIFAVAKSCGYPHVIDQSVEKTCFAEALLLINPHKSTIRLHKIKDLFSHCFGG